MDKRKVNIVRQIINNNCKEISLCQLANDFSVSERTIRNDIAEINEFFNDQGINMISLDNSGTVYLNGNLNKVKDSLQKMNFYDYSLSKEERVLINICILILTNRYVTYQEIGEFMYVSKFTVIKDSPDVNLFLKKFNLIIFSLSNKGLKIKGEEVNIRKVILNIITENTYLVNMLLWQKDLKEFIDYKNTDIRDELEIINKIIREVENENKAYFTDTSLKRLSYYLYFMIHRILYGKTILMENKETNSPMIEKIADRLIDMIGQYFKLNIRETEIMFLQNILAKLNYIKKEVDNSEILKIQMLTRKFIESVSKSLDINLNNDYIFFKNLSNHLESLFSDSNIKYPEYFGIDETVRNNKFVLNAVKENLKILEDYAERKISYIDIAFIVVYICAAIEKKKNEVRNLSVIIVCNSGTSTSQLLKEQLIKYFDFIVIEVLPSQQFESTDLDNADLIISTILLDDYGTEYIHVPPILSITDIINIDKKLDDIKMNKIRRLNKLNVNDKKRDDKNEDMKKRYKNDTHYSSLSDLLQIDKIKTNVIAADWRDAIRKSAEILEERGDINHSYTQSMIENVEKNGPYIVISKGFALPHGSYKKGVNNLAMSLIKLDKPVKFGVKELDPIDFVCAMSPIDDKSHLKAFFTLVNLLELKEFHMEIKKARTAEELFNIIVNYENAI
ncbi:MULTISPECIES: BglG family transcription antiterminator [Tissierellales]|jgi:transcriptional antiterminator|nr:MULTISPECIES: PTS sugar transporter subunit IIA [Tissierellales]SCL92584.1 Mannitol operon transcriptional activator [Sporanaerobacter sp. PP17-6a]